MELKSPNSLLLWILNKILTTKYPVQISDQSTASICHIFGKTEAQAGAHTDGLIVRLPKTAPENKLKHHFHLTHKEPRPQEVKHTDLRSGKDRICNYVSGSWSEVFGINRWRLQ